jgi:hypothetical protein
MQSRRARAILVAGLLLLVLPSPALAYIDPGAGSLLMQIVLGGTAMVAVLARIFWTRVRTFFGRPPKPPAGKDAPPV